VCGRYTSYLPPEAIARMFGASGPIPNIGPNWNVAPTQSAMVVRRHPETGERRLDTLRWGLVPSWTKDLKQARKPINAGSETAGTSGMFRSALANRRCIIPADTFYEWRTLPDGKQPYAIARLDGTPLAFAGVWEGWRAPDGETLLTYAILTTTSNATMAAIHDRMPVILDPADWHAWLDGEDANALLRPSPDDLLHLWPVSRAVNSVGNNGIELLDRIDGPD
jgi:putative SOS response-associated peptidase YedK